MRSSVVLTPLTQSIRVIKSKGTSNFDGYCTSWHPPKVSKPHILKMHILRDCKHILDDIRKKIEHKLGAYDSHKVPSITLTSSFSEVIPSEGPKRRSGEQVDFEHDVCEWFVACAIPWNAANNPQTQLFSDKWLLKNVFIPDQCILSGRVLDAHVKMVEDRVEGKVKDIFILAVFFNPYIHHEIFHPSALPERDLFKVVKHIFEQVYNQKSDIHLMTAYTDYRRKRSEFAFDKTELEDVAQMCSEPNLPLDLVFLWMQIDTQKDNNAPTGCNSMKLAIHILSVIANSAGSNGDKDAVARFEFYWKVGIRNLEAEAAIRKKGLGSEVGREK
ncbi:hypothetical protein CPB84DRAFT_1751754 [Gymnopilus junonius]|uniref:Uncharacterized protein n=1 Tax=Gymnopilus junonius TaxID=109634 RepID=A0A9P5NAW4_GYMJU|nr:hypothetical protein CPB84DRAFT_1751754 [Gymnopilus junonius]